MKYYKSAKEAKEVRDAAATKAVADIICQVRQDKDQALKDLADLPCAGIYPPILPLPAG